MCQMDNIIAVVSLAYSDTHSWVLLFNLSRKCCHPLSHLIRTSRNVKPESLLQTSFSCLLLVPPCKKQEKNNLGVATYISFKTRGHWICISNSFNWLITIHANTEFSFAILIGPKRNSLPKALEMRIFYFIQLFSLWIPWCSRILVPQRNGG